MLVRRAKLRFAFLTPLFVWKTAVVLQVRSVMEEDVVLVVESIRTALRLIIAMTHRSVLRGLASTSVVVTGQYVMRTLVYVSCCHVMGDVKLPSSVGKRMIAVLPV